MMLARLAALGVAVMLLASAAPARAATPVAGFKSETVARGLDWGIGMAFTPDGRMLIAEKRGIVKLRHLHGPLETRVILDISDHVNNYGDRGLTGIAVDHNFATNGYVYLYYTYDGATKDSSGPKTARLTRIVLRPDNKVQNVNLAPETILIGTYPALRGAEACPAGNAYDCIPADGISHVNGTVRAAADGTIYVGTGDAIFAAQNAPDPLRPLDPNSMAGKILRVDRNGNAVRDHPFCPGEANLRSACARVYAKGFRNPFRFDFAERGGLWVGDVGEYRYEELDQVVPGASYGWPCIEAHTRFKPRESDPRCQTAYAAGREVPPVFFFPHGDWGGCIISGAEIHSGRFPDSWQGDVFTADVPSGVIRRLEIDSLGTVTGEHVFSTSERGPTDIAFGPDGYLYEADFETITRFVPVTGNRPPEARATVTPQAGLAPMMATFDGSGSTDPDGDELSYRWTFGDGFSSTEATPVHTYATNGTHTATLTVSDPAGATATASVSVVVGTRPPELSFTAPASGFRYAAGQPVHAEVSATDPEDGTLPDAAISWKIVLNHNQHQHLLGTYTGRAVDFTPVTSHDADSHYVLEVSATDSAGVTTRITRRLDTRTIRLELATDPLATAELTYDGAPHPAPYVKDAAVGFVTTVVAPNTVTDADGRTLAFAGWSDGGAQTHDFTVPATDTRLVARYTADATPPDTVIDEKPANPTRDHQPTFRFRSTETPATFTCQMDVSAIRACSSPWKPATPLTNRTHTFRVWATDAAGNRDPTPATYEFLVVP